MLTKTAILEGYEWYREGKHRLEFCGIKTKLKCCFEIIEPKKGACRRPDDHACKKAVDAEPEHIGKQHRCTCCRKGMDYANSGIGPATELEPELILQEVEEPVHPDEYNPETEDIVKPRCTDHDEGEFWYKGEGHDQEYCKRNYGEPERG